MPSSSNSSKNFLGIMNIYIFINNNKCISITNTRQCSNGNGGAAAGRMATRSNGTTAVAGRMARRSNGNATAAGRMAAIAAIGTSCGTGTRQTCNGTSAGGTVSHTCCKDAPHTHRPHNVT